MVFSAEIFVRALTNNLDTKYDPDEFAIVRTDRTARIISHELADKIMQEPSWKTFCHIEKFASACAIWHADEWKDSVFKQRKDLATKAATLALNRERLSQEEQSADALKQYDALCKSLRKRISETAGSPEIEKVLVIKFLEARSRRSVYLFCSWWNTSLNMEFFSCQELQQVLTCEAALKER